MPEANDWNANIIEQFRANEGKVGPPFEGMSVLLLHHKGAKTGQDRVNPLAYQALDNGYAVFATKGGSPTNPDWYYNIKTNPDVTAEIGTDTVELRARVAQGDERERIWKLQKERFQGFAQYEEMTKNIREIPVIILEPR